MRQRGRRNDLETLRRAAPLHKTDYDYWDQGTKQAFHHSLFLWVPYFASGVMPVDTVDAYGFRTAFCPAAVLGFDSAGEATRRTGAELMDCGLWARTGKAPHAVVLTYARNGPDEQ